MDAVKKVFLIIGFLGLSSCQMGYLFHTAKGHLEILSSRVSLETAEKKYSLTPEQIRKLKLAKEAREFAETHLFLNKTKNYTRFVMLKHPYVSYVVSASPKWKLQHHSWTFPFVGKVPYKGFYDPDLAKEAEEELRQQNLDTYLRGVSAYSTLGWFEDPILSSMLNYSDYNLVDLIIHETVHSTLFIKNSADFNERLATFLGQRGAELFFLQKEGDKSPSLQKVRHQTFDDAIFSEFISAQIKSLENWYLVQSQNTESARENRFQLIKEEFKIKVLPHLRTSLYKQFSETPLNNARLLVYKTYMQDLSHFDTLFNNLNKNYAEFLRQVRALESHPDPEKGLQELINRAHRN